MATMPEESTTAIVQRYLGELTGEAPSEPVIRMLLDRSVLRLQRLCAILLHHDYRRLTHAPLNLQTDELLSAVVERLLNDLARRLDNQPAAVELREGQLPAPASSASCLSPDSLRMLEAIDGLPEDE